MILLKFMVLKFSLINFFLNVYFFNYGSVYLFALLSEAFPLLDRNTTCPVSLTLTRKHIAPTILNTNIRFGSNYYGRALAVSKQSTVQNRWSLINDILFL